MVDAVVRERKQLPVFESASPKMNIVGMLQSKAVSPCISFALNIIIIIEASTLILLISIDARWYVVSQMV